MLSNNSDPPPARRLHLFPEPLLESQAEALNTIFLTDFTRFLANTFTMCFVAKFTIVSCGYSHNRISSNCILLSFCSHIHSTSTRQEKTTG